MKVRDVMTSEVATAAPDTTLEEVATMMKEEDTGVIPVLDDDDELIGVVTDRDIVVRCIAGGMDPAETTVEEVLSEDLKTVRPDTDVREAARIMAERQIRRLPVVDENELVGMVSLGDIAVKAENDDMKGKVLEDVSEGVKPTVGRGRQQAGGGQRKQPARSAQGRQELDRTERKQAGDARQQGIANRRADSEKGRQQRVVNIRGKDARGREKSSRGRRKAG